MKDKDIKKYEGWIREMYQKYKSVLFIEKYHLRVEKDKEEKYLASQFNYPYLDIKILWSEESLKDWQKDKRDAERRIIHEFCHTLTDPFYCVCGERFITKPQIEAERERLTDHIAQIINKHFNL